MIQLRMHVGVNQSADNGGAKWLNYGYFKCRTHGFGTDWKWVVRVRWRSLQEN